MGANVFNMILYKIYWLNRNGEKVYLTRTNQLPFWVKKSSVKNKVSRHPDWFVETYELQLTNTQSSKQFEDEE